VNLKALGAALLFGSSALAQTPPPQPTPPTPDSAGAAPQAAPVPPAPAPAPTPAPPPPVVVAPAPAPAAPAASPFKLELHGFTSVTGYFQDASTGPSEGQQGLFTTREPLEDKGMLGFDVRQSRFNFSVAGPKVMMGATPKGVLEIDFFQGFGAGNYGNASLLNRLRLAYAELSWGAHRIQFGQQNDLVFAIAPTSLAHIAFPYGYAAGNIGWRRPGIFGFHTFATAAGGPKVEFAWEVARASWADAAANIGNNAVAAGTSQAVASAIPAFEGRVTVASGTLWSVFVAGHWNRVDGDGYGNDTPAGTNLNVAAVDAGAKVVAGPLTVQATGFRGRNLAPLIGNFLTFQPTTNLDVDEMGGWVQAGFNLTKQLSVWGFVGIDKPDQDDNRKVADANADRARFAARATTPFGGTLTQPAAPTFQFKNRTTAAMLQYRDGGFAVGLEWIQFHTKNASYAFSGDAAAGTPPTSVTFTGTRTAIANQGLLSANYFF
jgi:hypothetical protein